MHEVRWSILASMETPACDELLRRMRTWVGENYRPADHSDHPYDADRPGHERFWDEAIEAVVGEPPDGPGARPLTTNQRELLIAAFGEVCELAQAADDHADPRDATEAERTAAGCIQNIFRSRHEVRAFAEGLPRGEYDDQLRFAYFPVVNWLTNSQEGLMSTTLDLADVVHISEADDETIRRELGLP
jgi:hypothetical protein